MEQKFILIQILLKLKLMLKLVFEEFQRTFIILSNVSIYQWTLTFCHKNNFHNLILIKIWKNERQASSPASHPYEKIIGFTKKKLLEIIRKPFKSNIAYY